MTIRLTSVEAFEKILETLKQDPLYNEEVNKSFFKYCVDTIKEGLKDGIDEWYIDIDWIPDRESCKIVMVLRYHKRSDMPTDIEYLTDKLNIE